LARAGRWARRHRTAVTAAAAVLVAVTLASSVGAALIAREQRATEKERDRAEANFDLAWVVVDGLGEATADSETGRRANPSDPDRLRLVGNTVDVTRRVLAARPDEPDLRARAARVLWYAGHLGQFLNDAGPADEAYRESVALQRGLADQFPDHPDHRIQLSRVLRDRAGLLRRTGRLGEAAATAGEAVAVADRVRAADPAGWEPQFSLALALTVRYGAELARGQYAAAGRSAQESADLLDELLAAPRDRYHPYAPLFRADARSLRAVAVREEGRAGGGAWDPGPALRLHDEAVGRLRELVAADGRRDFLFQLYAALVQRAETGRTAPGREARAGRDLDEAVAGLAELARQHTAVGHYREELARGLIARGRVRATAARTVGDPAGSLAAEADLFRAVGLLEGLSQESPKLPEYRGLLGEAWAALAPLADDRAGTGLLGHPFPAAAGVVADRKALQTRVHRALSSFRRAQEFCPDDPSYPRRLAEEERAWGPVAAWVTAENQAGRR
ncbi:MAG: hypothetical protein K2X82_15645, partial [Gemmataceae bacterium]|nr:hypothetical protein [Gemmataceae bacterium]